MRKILTTVLLLTVVVSLSALAQPTAWEFVKAFPDTGFKISSGIHGLAVDPDGKVWIQPYSATEKIWNGTDSASTRALYVFNPDGTPSAINGIKVFTVGGVPMDTLYNSGRGLRKAHDGNIYACHYDEIFKFDYKTGEGIASFQPEVDGSLAAPGVVTTGSDEGAIFVGFVLPDLPVKIYDASFNYLGNVIDLTTGYYRTVDVSADGNDFYLTSFTLGALYWYHSDFGTFGPYNLADSLVGINAQSSCWNPKDGYLYLGTGGSDGPNLPPYSQQTWYAFDPVTKTLKDSIIWNSGASPGDCRPRAIAFSPGGDTAYVAEFNESTVPCVQMFKRTLTSVRPDPEAVPVGFQLDQNYPNPFNPSTEIKFSIDQSGLTTLVVYDLLGREIETLVNEDLARGAYRASFNASKLSSGTYIYRLTSNGLSITKKMMVLK
jgi:hypothetical protein